MRQKLTDFQDGRGAYVWQATSVSGEKTLGGGDYLKLKPSDYSIGLVDYCSTHGVNTTVMHVEGKKCKAQVRAVRAIHIRRQNQERSAAEKEARAAWIQSQQRRTDNPLRAHKGKENR